MKLSSLLKALGVLLGLGILAVGFQAARFYVSVIRPARHVAEEMHEAADRFAKLSERYPSRKVITPERFDAFMGVIKNTAPRVDPLQRAWQDLESRRELPSSKLRNPIAGMAAMFTMERELSKLSLFLASQLEGAEMSLEEFVALSDATRTALAETAPQETNSGISDLVALLVPESKEETQGQEAVALTGEEKEHLKRLVERGGGWRSEEIRVLEVAPLVVIVSKSREGRLQARR
jgi:hypothetical protein